MRIPRQHKCRHSSLLAVVEWTVIVFVVVNTLTTTDASSVIPTSLCDSDTCQNGGKCNGEYPYRGEMCLCPRTNTGLYCESPSETSTSSSAAASCTLQCANGGDCKLGTRSDSELADAYRFWHSDSGDTDTSSSGSISNKNMYCQCTESWDGPECLVAKVPCGTNHCFHGSECLTRSEGGKTVHRCDCAVIADGDFAGQFCQYPATSQCAAADEARGIPALFCVNQGQCQAQAANAYQGCICSTDFTGFSCEFRTNAVLTTPTTNNNNTATTSPQQPVVYNSTSESDQDVHEIDENENFGRPLMDDPNAVACNVECQNEGTCRHGQKEPDEAWDTATKNTTHLTSSTTTIIKTETEEFAHCVCPDNFAGNYCEHPVDECGAANGKFLCLHGSKCVNVGEEQLCDCDVADSNLATFFAGAHCQHPVDDICTTKGTTNGNGVTTTSSVTFFGNAIPGTSMAFCVNGGKCKEYVAPTNPHPGCICNEGFLGPHCELRESAELPKNPYANSLNEDDRSATESHRFYAVAFWVLLIASAMVVMFVVARAFWRRRLIERHAAVTSSIQWSPAFKDRGTKNNEINIAPGSTYSDLYEEAFSRSTVASTGRSSLRNIHTHEPFSDHDCKQEDDDINESDEECEEEQTAFSDQMHMEPRIDLGPPIDEDGHELHNVEIV